MEELVPMVVCTGMFAMIFGIVYLRSRENMAMIERGMNPKETQSRPKPFVNLKYGLLLLGCGFGLLIAYLIDVLILRPRMAQIHGGDFSSAIQHNHPAIYFALLAIGGGAGLFLSYTIEKKEWLDKIKDK